MGRTGFLLIGAAVGAAVGIVYNYLFGPAEGTEYNEAYRSRWDKAVEDGERAADEREAQMRRQFSIAKKARPQSAEEDAGQLPGDTQ